MDISSSIYNLEEMHINLEINISTVLAIRMSSGKSFHALTVAMLNARSPYVMSLVLDSSKRRGSSDDRRPL